MTEETKSMILEVEQSLRYDFGISKKDSESLVEMALFKYLSKIDDEARKILL